MPKIHTRGRWFAHAQTYPSRRFPLMERGTTQEIEFPFRRGSALVVRLPGSRRALVAGVWRDFLGERAALMSALGAREVDWRGLDEED